MRLPMWQANKNGHTRSRLTLWNAFVNVQQPHTLCDPKVSWGTLQQFCMEARGQLRTHHLGVQTNLTT